MALRHQSRRGLSRNPTLCSLLEMQLQRYLQGTRSAQLIDGTEPSELAGEGCVGLAKERPVVQRVVDGAEAGMIEDVVDFGAELKANPVCKWKIPEQGHIGLHRIEASGGVAAGIAFDDIAVRVVQLLECLWIDLSSCRGDGIVGVQRLGEFPVRMKMLSLPGSAVNGCSREDVDR